MLDRLGINLPELGVVLTVLGSVFKILLAAGAVFGISWFVAGRMGFKHCATIRHLTGGKIVVVRDKAKIMKSKSGIKKIRLLKTKETIAIPPDDVVNTTNTGKYHFDVYRTQEGQYIWAVDNFKVKNIKIPDGLEKVDFEAMNTMDREWYANEYEESERYRKKNIWDIAAQAIPYVFMVIVFALLFVYWGDIAAPAKESQQMSLQVIDKADKVLDKANQILLVSQGQQVVLDDQEISKVRQNLNLTTG